MNAGRIIKIKNVIQRLFYESPGLVKKIPAELEEITALVPLIKPGSMKK